MRLQTAAIKALTPQSNIFNKNVIIASQAPNNIGNFIDAVKKENIKLIITLCEFNKGRCYDFVDVEEDSKVKYSFEDDEKTFTFRLVDIGGYEVFHVIYNGWPDQRLPASDYHILKMAQIVDYFYKQNESRR
jgi:hypothetical protein